MTGTDQENETDVHAPVGTGEKSGAGPLIGAGIVIVLLAIGALYFWSEDTKRRQNPASVPMTAFEQNTDAGAEATGPQQM
jgi:hypothetical protein